MVLPVGGGNYRQSSVTVDGAAFSNSFGIGSNVAGRRFTYFFGCIGANSSICNSV